MFCLGSQPVLAKFAFSVYLRECKFDVAWFQATAAV